MGKRSKYLSKGWWNWRFRLIKEYPEKSWTLAVAQYRTWFPKQLTDDEQWNTWQTDVQTIKDHIVGMFGDRVIFRETGDMLRAQPELVNNPNAAYWYQWLRLMYAHYLAMAVRRELDRGATAPNLYRLLHQISKRPKVLSRERYLRHFGDNAMSRIHGIAFWSNNFTTIAGTGAYIDPAIVKKDIDETTKRAGPIVTPRIQRMSRPSSGVIMNVSFLMISRPQRGRQSNDCPAGAPRCRADCPRLGKSAGEDTLDAPEHSNILTRRGMGLSSQVVLILPVPWIPWNAECQLPRNGDARFDDQTVTRENRIVLLEHVLNRLK